MTKKSMILKNVCIFVKWTIILFILFVVFIIPTIYPALIVNANSEPNFASNNFEPNKKLLKAALFQKEELQKIHRDVQNKIEESPDKMISVLIKQGYGDSYSTKNKGLVGAQSLDNKLIEKIENSKGKIKLKTSNYIAVEIPASKLKEVVSDNAVEKVYPERIYHATLDKSAGLINTPAFWNSNYKGNGIKIAILDTGIDSSHPMLLGKIIAEKVFTGENHVDDVNGHGTHVAGISAGRANEQGFQGIAPEALLINVKVLGDNGIGTTSGIIAGIEWAVDPDRDPRTDDGADVISMSLGGAYSGPDVPYEEAIKNAISKGVVVVVSSGNCGSGCPSADCGSFRGVTSPGNVREAITVGAVDDNNTIACFSSGEDIPSVGIKPDVVAPGKNIMSSIPGGN